MDTNHLELTRVAHADPTDCPYYLMTRASLAATSELKRALAAADLAVVRPAYLGVLFCLAKEDGQRVVDLGRGAGLEPSTMTGLLDRMERDELIERRPDEEDRRALRIFLTERSRQALPQIAEARDSLLAKLLAGVSPVELIAARRTLAAVLENASRD
ncbi:MAG: MarR family transcriptional regulator [Candidatus Schekmanbacteria bacterium]|nr:MarR family transcriptional regulator [Candidatus Schekmanbacteria bacterium]